MDKHRPQYHFLPPANWMNDPNGLVQWQGIYHLFYQHNPDAAYWGNMHWGHASSRDLIHWQHLPIALAPTPGGPDRDGVWSGCAVNWDGVPTMAYTGRIGETENVCLACSRDELRSWEKHPGNPVIPAPPPGLDQVGFRDPCIWRQDGQWMMVIGSGIRDVGGAILLYSSPDLIDWRYMGPMISGDVHQKEPVWTGEMWECPNFFPVGAENRWMLMFSPMGLHPSRSLYTLYFLGKFENNTFVPDKLAKMDGGDMFFYAPQAFLDEHGRRLVIGWAREARSVKASVEAGWAGVMTLPRLLAETTDGDLSQRPAPEVDALRGAHQSWENISLDPSGPRLGLVSLDGLAGDTLELDITFDFETGGVQDGEFGLLVRHSPGDEEVTEIRVDRLAKIAVVDTLRSSLSSEVYPGQFEIPLDLPSSGKVNLRVYLDRSMLEVFIDDRAAITARVYPTREDSTGITLFARRRSVRVNRLDLWEMNPAA